MKFLVYVCIWQPHSIISGYVFIVYTQTKGIICHSNVGHKHSFIFQICYSPIVCTRGGIHDSIFNEIYYISNVTLYNLVSSSSVAAAQCEENISSPKYLYLYYYYIRFFLCFPLKLNFDFKYRINERKLYRIVLVAV